MGSGLVVPGLPSIAVRRLTSLVLAVCLLAVVPFPGLAASQMNCGSALVKLGDGKTEVLAKCGEPDYREVVSGNDESKREIWVYRFGSSKFTHTLTFTGFRLDDIVVETYR
jgi:hypothetical protein